MATKPYVPSPNLEDLFIGVGKNRTDEQRRAQAMAKGVLAAYPSLAQAFADQIQPIDETLAASIESYFPRIAEVQRQQALKDAEATRQIFTGDLPAFQQGARTVDQLAREFDPEFYKTRSTLAGGLNDLMQPGLTGGERSEVERAINQRSAQTGNLNSPANLETVANAATYGGAARDRFTQGLNLANQALPNLKTQVSSPSSISAGVSTKAPVTTPGTGLDLGQNLLSQIGGVSATSLEADLTPQPATWEKAFAAMPDY